MANFNFSWRERCLFLALLLSSTTAHSVEISAGISDFHPVSNIVRRVFHSDMPQYRLELEQPYKDGWTVWLNGSYVEAKGRSRDLSNKTFFNLWSTAVGVRYTYPINDLFSGYVGAGPSYSFLNMSNDSPYVKRHIKKGSLGLLGEVGTRIDLGCGKEARLFVGYSYLRFHNSGHYRCVKEARIDMSALLFGGSIGFCF